MALEGADLALEGANLALERADLALERADLALERADLGFTMCQISPLRDWADLGFPMYYELSVSQTTTMSRLLS